MMMTGPYGSPIAAASRAGALLPKLHTGGAGTSRHPVQFAASAFPRPPGGPSCGRPTGSPRERCRAQPSARSQSGLASLAGPRLELPRRKSLAASNAPSLPRGNSAPRRRKHTAVRGRIRSSALGLRGFRCRTSLEARTFVKAFSQIGQLDASCDRKSTPTTDSAF